MSQPASTDGTPRSSHDGRRLDMERDSLDVEGMGEAENAFQRAIATWRSIDLSSLQKQLDSEASDIITNQRDDLVERKEVAQKTKDFRKLGDADKLVEYKGLLKAYQQFIDHISNHRKSTESLFLNVYNHLSEAPDPYPLLEATIDSLVSSEDVSRLTSEKNSLQTTVSRLTAQNQHLESRIDELKREAARKDNEVARAAEKAEEAFQAVLDEKTVNWEAKERNLLDKIGHQDRILKEQKASYEASIRMGKVAEGSIDEDMGGGASLAELEILNSDLERTTMRLAEMENRNEQLRSQLAQSLAVQNNAAPGKTQKDYDEADEEIQRLEAANSNLFRKIEAVKKENEDKIRDFEKKERHLSREIDTVKKERTILKEKIKAWSDYDEIKRELEVLKTIEFSTGDDDEEAPADDTTSGKKESLEQLLLARNKKLGNELTVLRVSHQDLTSRLEELQRTVQQTNTELIASRNLNNQLEDDLQKVQSQAQFPAPAMSVAGTYVSRYQPSQAGNFGPRVNKSSPTSSIISGKIPHSSSQPTFEALRAANAEPANNAGILPMLTAQRDRYKARTSQLEDELSRTQDTVTSLRQEIASLQKDNLQLYEKTRYVSSYARQAPNTAASSSNAANRNMPPNVHNNPTTSSGLSLDRYRQAYEANLSPFEAFRNRESVRALNRMGVLERMMYSMTRMVMKNRLTRNLFAGYCLFLHLVCFGVLYWAGMGEMERGLTGGGLAAPMAAHDSVRGTVGGGEAAGAWRPDEAPVGP